MAKPPVPTWATDATIATGPQAGQSTRLEPASGYKAQGAVAEKSAPARFMNWLFGSLCDAAAYALNIENEPDFLAANFNWDGAGQHLFNGATYFAGTPVISGALNEMQYFSSKTRTIYLPWVDGAGRWEDTGSSSGFMTGSLSGCLDLTRNGNFGTSGHASRGFVLPQGATLRGWDVLCATNNQAFNFQFECKQVAHDWATPTVGTPATVGSVQSQSGVALTTYRKGQSGLGDTATAGKQYWIDADIMSSPGGSPFVLTLWGVRITYTEQRATGSH